MTRHFLSYYTRRWWVGMMCAAMLCTGLVLGVGMMCAAMLYTGLVLGLAVYRNILQ